jgi:hypothetical protein
MDIAQQRGFCRGRTAVAAIAAVSLLALFACSKPSQSTGPVVISAPGSATFDSNAASISVPVKIVNQGKESISSEIGFNLSYHLMDEKGAPLKWDNPRSAIPAIAPGKDATVPMVVTRPEKPGKYVLEIDVVHENVTWLFSLGVKVARVKLDVPIQGKK